ncbi:MAG: class I SAM-dependent methyltransferase [Gaiella sp.]
MRLTAALTRRLVYEALDHLRGGELVLRWPDGRGKIVGDGDGPRVTVDLHRPDALFDKLARRPRLAIPESYVDGDWDADDLVGVLGLIVRNVGGASRSPLADRLSWVARLRTDRAERETESRAKGDAEPPLEVGNELFELMLDPTMSYSCAYWERPDMTLEEAQRAKLHRVCEKLRLGSEDHVLDLGCGFGAFAIHAASEHGCRVTGLTLSRAERELAQERVRSAGVEALVEIREQDYREVEGRFSRIASIEVLPTLGHADHERFFRALDQLLGPDGIAVVQTIGIPDDRFEGHRRQPNWIQQEIFPGSLLPSLEAIARAVAKTGLIVLDLEEIGYGCAATLRAWRENVENAGDRVRALGYGERFDRVWRFYLAFSEAAFAARALRDMQLVLTRPGNSSLEQYPALRYRY